MLQLTFNQPLAEGRFSAMASDCQVLMECADWLLAARLLEGVQARREGRSRSRRAVPEAEGGERDVLQDCAVDSPQNTARARGFLGTAWTMFMRRTSSHSYLAALLCLLARDHAVVRFGLFVAFRRLSVR